MVSDYYIIIGDAYVQGFMDGEAIQAIDAGTLTQQQLFTRKWASGSSITGRDDRWGCKHEKN